MASQQLKPQGHFEAKDFEYVGNWHVPLIDGEPAKFLGGGIFLEAAAAFNIHDTSKDRTVVIAFDLGKENDGFGNQPSLSIYAKLGKDGKRVEHSINAEYYALPFHGRATIAKVFELPGNPHDNGCELYFGLVGGARNPAAAGLVLYGADVQPLVL